MDLEVTSAPRTGVAAQRLEALLAPRALDVPLLPEAASRVMAAARAPEPDLRKLIDLIQRDPALTGHVLRVANSAAYARGARLSALPQAVSRLGLAAIGEIALVVSCRTRLFRGAGLEREVRQIFRHSYAAALFAQEIARSRRLCVETAFVAGLMHDVGRPLLLELIAAHRAELGSPEPAVLAALVDQHHAEVGAVIVDKWQLGPRVVESVRHHHDAVVTPATALVQLADVLCHLLLDDLGELSALAYHPARLALNLYDDELAAIAAHRDAVRSAVDVIEGLG